MSRNHFMGNGYADQVLSLIIKNPSAQVVMSPYDFMILKSKADVLNDVFIQGNLVTVGGSQGFTTKVSTSPFYKNLQMSFSDRYTPWSYLLIENLYDTFYLLTEDDNILIV